MKSTYVALDANSVYKSISSSLFSPRETNSSHTKHKNREWEGESATKGLTSGNNDQIWALDKHIHDT